MWAMDLIPLICKDVVELMLPLDIIRPNRFQKVATINRTTILESGELAYSTKTTAAPNERERRRRGGNAKRAIR